jgi:predicted ATPase
MPLVGRQEEMGLLLRAWENSREGRGQIVLVQGEAGIGKSRLLEALRAEIGKDSTWVAIRSSPYHQSSTLYPAIEHMKRVFRWQPEDDTQTRLEKLETALEQYRGLPSDEAVPLLADMMSLPLPQGRYPPLSLTPEQQREATIDALNDWLTEEAESQPMLLVWEDLHWADPTTVEMLGLLIEQVPTVAMLVVGTFRPEFQPPWPIRSHVTPITLSRLERAEVEAIVTNLAGGKVVPEEVVEHIVAKADGVPLYVEELTKTLLDSEVLREETERYALTGALTEVHVPETLQDSLMARLDRVPTLREVAQLGAVIGREFAYEMLRHLVSQDERALQDCLSQLVELELLYQRGRGARARYMFKHALIQDAAYESLLRRTRQTFHGQVARLIEGQLPETLETHPELLAHHYTEAGEIEQALEYWLRAAELAKSRYAHQEATTHLQRGIGLVKELSDPKEQARRELAFQFSLGGAYLQMKGHSAPEVEVAFARARQLCDQVGDAPELVPTLFGLWRTYVVQMADITRPRDVAAQLLRLVTQNDDPVSAVIAHYAVGFTALVAGDFVLAARHLREGLGLYDRKDRDASEVYRFGQDPGVACLCYLALAEWALGSPDQARRLVEEGQALAVQVDDPFTLAFAAAIGSFVYQARGDIEATLTAARQAVTQSTKRGFPYWLGIGSVICAWAEASREPTAGGLEVLRGNIAKHRAMGTELFAGYFLTLLGQAALAGDDTDLCAEAVEAAERVLERTGERWWECETRRLRAELDFRLERADPDTTQALLREIAGRARCQEARAFELRAAISASRVLRDIGDETTATATLAPVLDRFSEGSATADLAEAQSILLSVKNSAPG